MTPLEIALPARGDTIGWRNREWIVTNGLGGYASGSLAGVCTRRYHGVFVPNLPRPRGRHVMVSRLDEEILVDGQAYRLGGSDRRGEPLGSASAAWLRSFRLDGNIATWIFDCGGLTLERQIVMPHQRNTTCLRYVVTQGFAASIRLRPWLPFRRQDADLRQPGYARFGVQHETHGGCRVDQEDTELALWMRMSGGARFVDDEAHEPDAWLWREELRGYAAHESLSSPGYFEWQAAPGAPAVLVFTTERDPLLDIDRPFQEERQRNAALVERAAMPGDAFAARLAIAADQFLILPENRLEESQDAARRGHALRSVAAGYFWFLDWGRDTMIALEGLMLATGRHQEARATLLTFSHYVRDGLLPNLFPEGARQGRYHTVDATLWYFHAIHRYLIASGDHSLLEELLPVLRNIMRHHMEGTRFGIGLDPDDGLLAAGTSAHALTWMDAHMGDWIVTPRRGKPVEIQALWYNALCLMRQWETRAAEREAYARVAELARRTFNARFWNLERHCLFDVIEGEDGDDPRLRPNQLFAISLDHPILESSRWRAVVDTVAAELLTPFGLRTLDARDPAYSSHYHGNLKARDAAYHQGTVWPWLLGAYVDAWLKVHRDPAQARALLAAFPEHLHQAGTGSISEVFDAEAPHVPHGCIAQAWSVAEVLRCWKRTAAR